MLDNLSEQVRECLQHAEDCARKAAAQPEGSPLRQDFLDMERRWLGLARSMQHSERLTSFLKKPSDSTPPKTGLSVNSILCPRCRSPMTWFAAQLANDRGSVKDSYQCDSCGFTDQTTEKPQTPS